MEVRPVVEMRRQGWTFDDLATIDDEEWRRYETVDGSLVVSPSATPFHEFVSAEIRAALRTALGTARPVIGPVSVNLGRSHLTPDLVVVTTRALRRDAKQIEPAVALLAVEVVSGGSVTMDRVLKPAKFAAAGISAHWRVETDPVSLTAYVRRDGAYAELGTWHTGQVAEIAEPFAVRIEMVALVPPSG